MTAPLVVIVTPEAGERVAYSRRETAALLGVSTYAIALAIKEKRLHEVALGPQMRVIPAWSIQQLLGGTDA